MKATVACSTGPFVHLIWLDTDHATERVCIGKGPTVHEAIHDAYATLASAILAVNEHDERERDSWGTS